MKEIFLTINHKQKNTDMKTFQIKIALFTLLLLQGCQAIKTAVYDQYSYQKTTELKVETLLAIENATTSFEDHQQMVEKVCALYLLLLFVFLALLLTKQLES